MLSAVFRESSGNRREKGRKSKGFSMQERKLRFPLNAFIFPSCGFCIPSKFPFFLLFSCFFFFFVFFVFERKEKGKKKNLFFKIETSKVYKPGITCYEICIFVEIRKIIISICVPHYYISKKIKEVQADS